MKKKELKSIATRIAEAEKIVAVSTDTVSIRKAKETIMQLTERLVSTDDLLQVDDMVQEILSKND